MTDITIDDNPKKDDTIRKNDQGTIQSYTETNDFGMGCQLLIGHPFTYCGLHTHAHINISTNSTPFNKYIYYNCICKFLMTGSSTSVSLHKTYDVIGSITILLGCRPIVILDLCRNLVFCT